MEGIMENNTLHKLGIDIGSTTVKVAILDQKDHLLFSDYERHFANIQETLSSLLQKAYDALGDFAVAPMITGSGGLTLALETLAPRYLEMGINPGVLHKIASAACITLDSLPHNGVMVTVLACCGLTHKEGYKHLFAITVVGSIIILIEAIVLASIMYPIG
mgnify:CR=1 FL=1